MAKAADDPRTFITRLSLLHRSSGAVKNLRAFDKKRHTVPDAVNAHTQSFLAKLCAAELVEEAEEVFQRTRAILGYKRAQLSLDVTSPFAVLAAKDFTFELAYALDEADPASYELTRLLHALRQGDLLFTEEFDALFAARFEAIRFTLRKGMRVEAVIDAVEELDSPDTLRVDYPSDCRDCILTVPGIDASVHCDGACLEMRFPRPGSPRELIEAFAAVRSAFALTKSRPLAGLL